MQQIHINNDCFFKYTKKKDSILALGLFTHSGQITLAR